jgi:predicted RNase H-like HicB family nuclease
VSNFTGPPLDQMQTVKSRDKAFTVVSEVLEVRLEDRLQLPELLPRDRLYHKLLVLCIVEHAAALP